MRLRKEISAEQLCYDDLNREDTRLIREALRVRGNAQAPYSRYHVGAVVETAHGRLFSGCNVERVSYSQTTHAEQAAVDAMVAALGRNSIIRSVAVVGAPKHVTLDFTRKHQFSAPEMFVSPSCGHCLQIIWENCANDPGVRLLCATARGDGDPWIQITTIGDAFPMRFDISYLNVKAR